MVKTTTKISTHVLKLLHDVSKGDNCLDEEEGVEGQEEGAAGSTASHETALQQVVLHSFE